MANRKKQTPLEAARHKLRSDADRIFGRDGAKHWMAQPCPDLGNSVPKDMVKATNATLDDVARVQTVVDTIGSYRR